jgi:hypothetical protein
VKREKALKCKQRISEDGGHLMLKTIYSDLNDLDESLKAESLAYFRTLEEV